MKRLLLIIAACFAATGILAQIPMPKWVLSEAYEAQCGVANYVNEKFDLKRLPADRVITDFLWLKDTASTKKYIYKASICDVQGEVAQLGFQSDTQVSRNSDTITFVSTCNPYLEVSLNKYLPIDASEELIARTVDSLKNIRLSADELVAAGAGLLPARQNGFSYVLQYFFARHGIDASPLFMWQTMVMSPDDRKLMAYCLEKAEKMKIGKDIERFARKVTCTEEYLYAFEVPEGAQTAPTWFFYRDGKFWAKIGMSQYKSYDSLISVWRHNKKSPALIAYKLSIGHISKRIYRYREKQP